jgi:hypothetical protein
MNNLLTLSKKAGDELQIHYVALSDLADKLLAGNSKLHSIDDLTDSIERYDFQDPMKYDPSLNGGEGGIVEGNGRLEWSLDARDSGRKAPRGIKVQDDEWFVPVVFGVEFASEQEAIAYSVSHNLSALWGSGLETLDSIKLFDEDLLKAQLTGRAEMDVELPVGLGDGLELWMGLEDEPERNIEKSLNEGDQKETNIDKQWGVIVFCEDETEQVELIDSLLAEGKKCKALM